MADDPIALQESGSTSSAMIVARLRRAIVEGRYVFNERLPPERQLAGDFSAARGTVREALRQLESMALVKRRVGSGTFVSYRPQRDQQSIAELTSPLELIDVRFGIEPQMVRLAVLNASAADLQRLHDAAEKTAGVDNDAEAFTAADAEFHLALAESTRNPLMVWLYQQLNEVRSHPQWSEMKDKVLSPRRTAEYGAQHLALYRAIAARDIDDAVAQIKNHLSEARRDLLGADPL